MKDGLPTVRIRIHNDPIALGADPCLLRHVARKREQLAKSTRILRVVERADVGGWDHQEMGRRLGADILEGQHAIGALDYRRRNLASHNFAENAAVFAHSSAPLPLRRLGRSPSSSPNARRIVSQNPLPCSSGTASSTSLSCSSNLRCSGVSLDGVQTWTRTWRSPCPASPSRGSPLWRSRYAIPVWVPGSRRNLVCPYGVGTSTSAPRAAWVKVIPRSKTRSSPCRSNRGSSLMSSTAIKSPRGPLRGPGTPCPRTVR